MKNSYIHWLFTSKGKWFTIFLTLGCLALFAYIFIAPIETFYSLQAFAITVIANTAIFFGYHTGMFYHYRKNVKK